MNARELARFRNIILKMIADLEDQSERGKDGQAVVMLDQQAVGRLSRMDALQSQSMAHATQARRATRIVALQAALTRMEDDEFGYCLDCGEEIALKRLELDPAAAKCINCASAD